MPDIAPNAVKITVRETLDLLDGPFAEVAKGVAEDRYALWLGSGISFGRVDGLRQVIARVIEFLRVRIVAGGFGCRFKKAIYDVLALASLSEEERVRVNLALPFAMWQDADAIVGRLVNQYARLLDIDVDGEANDYLLWEAVDIRSTFADPNKVPDVEHLCLAILALEGASTDIASANWDGLIESSVARLSGGQAALTVCARPEDLREPVQRARLIKFHGCAIRAVQDEGAYRPFLVARLSQINGWADRPENAALMTRLVDIIATKPTLMMGLSVQDSNIQGLFAKAAANLVWRWPGDRPSYVFSENELGVDQRALLHNVYKLDETPANRQQIFESSRIQAYAKPLLVALVLHVLCTKVTTLIDLAAGPIGLADRQPLRDGVIAFRNQLSTYVEPDALSFINTLVDQCGRSMQLIRNGSLADAHGRYQALTTESIRSIAGNPGLPASGLRETAVAVGLLGAGLANDDWTVVAPDPSSTRDGMIHVNTTSGVAKVFLASGPHAALQLRYEGHVIDADEPIVIQGLKLAPSMARSPRGAPGRTGRTVVREVSIASLLESSTTFDELFQRFREELAI